MWRWQLPFDLVSYKLATISIHSFVHCTFYWFVGRLNFLSFLVLLQADEIKWSALHELQQNNIFDLLAESRCKRVWQWKVALQLTARGRSDALNRDSIECTKSKLAPF
jgi:hypothetical protein